MFSTTVPKTGLALVLPAAAVAVAIAGCGSSGTASAGTGSSTPAPVSAPATVTDTVVPPTTTTTATSGASSIPTATGPIACATANLTVSLGTVQGAAGSAYYPLHFVNSGSAACTITGYPGVSTVAPGTGAQVGPAATRSASSPTRTVTLATGAEATALVRLTSYEVYPASSCKAAAVSGFRVYPPNNTAAAYVALSPGTQVCTGEQTLFVEGPVVAGTTGQ